MTELYFKVLDKDGNPAAISYQHIFMATGQDLDSNGAPSYTVLSIKVPDSYKLVEINKEDQSKENQALL